MGKSNKEKAVKELANLIKHIDNNSFLFKYLEQSTSVTIEEMRSTAFECLKNNGYTLGDEAGNYKPKPIKK